MISLDDAARAELEAVSRRATASFRLVQWARIVLLAASGLENRAIADRPPRAAYDVHRAQVMGRCKPSTAASGRSPRSWTRSCAPSRTPRPGGSSGSSTAVHRTGTGRRQPGSATPHPNAQMVHLPVHASWPNQVYFSVIQRKLRTPDDFEGLDELAEQVLAFEQHYNATARPFDWRFTRTGLNKLLTRVRRHDRHAPPPLLARSMTGNSERIIGGGWGYLAS